MSKTCVTTIVQNLIKLPVRLTRTEQEILQDLFKGSKRKKKKGGGEGGDRLLKITVSDIWGIRNKEEG